MLAFLHKPGINILPLLMNKKLPLLVWLCHTLSAAFCFAQLQITYPTDRIVVQRNQSNYATITIAGYFATCQDKVEARFVPIQSNVARPPMGQPTPVGGDWQTIRNTATCGNFRSTMVVPGGWYRLEVRGVRSGQNPTVSQVDHVGVGEVFLVSGQSNISGGDNNPTGPGASEDAVSSVHFRTNIEPYNNLQVQYPVYTHLDQNTTTAPFGNYAWCWGYFGDRMVKKLNVPVMIFNAGWSGSSIANWQQTIPPDGKTIAWFGYEYPAGLPFGNMRIALNHYIAQLGVRAILWHQGESDTKTETSRESYRNDLREVIEACRDLSNKPNLSFVVSRASRYSFKKEGDIADVSYTSADVIAAQNDIIGIPDATYKVPYVFEGPPTDDYYDNRYRSDQVHFSGAGLDSLAKFWSTHLNDQFFADAVPYPAITPAEVTITGNTLHAADGWNSYTWLSNVTDLNAVASTSQQFPATPGIYHLKTVDSFTNTVYAPAVHISANALPVTWKYFKGNATENLAADLQWATTNEDNSAVFEIERMSQNGSFEKISSVSAAGNSSVTKTYYFTDRLLNPGHFYYRIKQIDMDGKSAYSSIINLRVSGKSAVKLFPNPIENILTIESETAIRSLEVFNEAGIRIHRNDDASGLQKLDMSRYQRGSYIIRLNGESFRIIK
jgi:hypothetical protein